MIPVRAVIAAALKDRAAYERASLVDFPESLEDTPRKIWGVIQEFYERDPAATATDIEVLGASLKRLYTNPKHQKAALNLLEGLSAEPVSAANVNEYLYEERRERVGVKLARAIDAHRSKDEIDPLLEEYQTAVDDRGSDVEEESGDVPWREALRSRTSTTDRLKVTPKALNDRLGGGLLPGHNVTIFGRPESGKSALALTMAVGFARRGLKVLYAGNEDPIQDLMVRAISNIAGLTLAEMAKNPDLSEVEAVKKGVGNIIFRQVCPGTLKEVEHLVKKIQPKVLVIDQLRNISSRSENFTQNLDAVARGIRAIGIKYGVVTISVTQAGDSAEGKSILTMGDIDSSNTGIPGAADVLVGVGVTEVLEKSGLRTLSLPKNKVGMVHEHFTVKIDPARSRITTPS